MKKPFLTIGRVVLTLLIVSFAVVVVWRMVMYYMFAPWTRDGHIRADIVQIARTRPGRSARCRHGYARHGSRVQTCNT